MIANQAERPTRALFRTVAHVLGSVLIFIGIGMATAAVVSVLHRETGAALGIGAAALATSATGLVTRRLFQLPASITVKQGFATVGLAWFVFSLFGTLPYLFTGAIPDFADAFFETASGFTTTGSSVLPNPETLPHGILFWRALTQWLGGLGVIVLGVAVLPLLGTGGMQLVRAETSGPAVDRLAPKLQGTAKRLWLVYGVLTVTEIVFLYMGDMTGFEAVVHSMATMSTGGFATKATSLASFSAYTKWVITVFMFLGGISFALHFRAFRRPVDYARSAELRLYVILVVSAVILATGGLLPRFPFGEALLEGGVTVVSIITTTGFASSDFGLWRPALQVLIVGLMFLGGMAGSTAGGIKTFRIGVLTKAAYADLRRLVHPRGVFRVTLGRQKVSDPVVESVQSFFLFYMFLFMTATFLLTFIDANLGEDLDLITSASAVASAMGNIGPGLGDVGPAYNFAFMPAPAKFLLSGLMILGRLEIFPVLVLFTRDLWKR
ncbi:MAG: TrkH family potassium uptake protein [Acidimicrobiales bacterium]|nr:TrkH family potassium uptake protein [Acidimicrobiales bacterium]